MKRFAAISLLVLAGFCSAGIAQAQNRTARAKIPFDFAVAGKTLPAGEYEFSTQSNDRFVIIRNLDQSAALVTMTRQAEPAAGSSRLVFNKYGDSYFLHEIQCSSIAVNADFPQSKQEKQLHQHLAWLGPDTVLLALNGN